MENLEQKLHELHLKVGRASDMEAIREDLVEIRLLEEQIAERNYAKRD